jgi:hypothetical protein
MRITKLREQARTLREAAKNTKDPDRRRELLDEALLLALHAEALEHHGGSSAPEPTCSHAPAPRQLTYGLYLIAGKHFADARHFTVGSDESALAVAYAVHDACSEVFQDFELWQESRQVAGNAQKRGPRPFDSAAEVTAATQQRVVELEEALMTSRQSVAESQKLLAATEALREKLGRERDSA